VPAVVVVLAGQALAASGPAAGRATTRPTLTLRSARVVAHWREGWFKGSVVFAGRVGAPATLDAVLRRVGGGALPTQDAFTVRRARSFTRKLTLPARPMPGVYRLRLTGSTAGGDLQPVERNVVVPSPPEGVVDRAIISVTPGGRRVRSVAGPRHLLFARFHFLAAPRARTLEVVWRTPSYHVFSISHRHYATTIYTRVQSTSPLQPGIWYCILLVDGKIAKR
jgi:hypothetical protein